jgi:hypothetical protein
MPEDFDLGWIYMHTIRVNKKTQIKDETLPKEGLLHFFLQFMLLMKVKINLNRLNMVSPNYCYKKICLPN